jgi:hypothetical protein
MPPRRRRQRFSPACRRRRAIMLPLLQPEGLVCGVDEAGRGPLAGPVVAAAVILDPARPIAGLNDSKQLSAGGGFCWPSRFLRALAWAVAEASVEEIDRINILQASLLAMQRAVAALVARHRTAPRPGAGRWQSLPELRTRWRPSSVAMARLRLSRRRRFSPRPSATPACSNCTAPIRSTVLTATWVIRPR